MSKKNSIKKIAALALGVALTMGATGCDFIRTNSVKDLDQTVATVNIANKLSEEDAAKQLNAILEIGSVDSGKLRKRMMEIPKRDLVSYFMSIGYQNVQSGYSYEDTFNMLLDKLVSRKIVTQSAILYYLTQEGSKLTVDGCNDFIDAEIEKAKTEREEDLLKKHPEISAMKYFLTEYDVDTQTAAKQDLWDKTLYQIFSAINNSLDSTEEAYITASDEEHDHSDARTKPTNADAEKEDFYIAPRIVGNEVDRYEVYTGLNKNGIPYGYEALDGSTVTTRKKAYNTFIGNLDDNGLIKKEDNTSVIYEMEYYYVELAGRLEQALIEKYTDDLIAQGEADLSETYLNGRYNQTYNAQKLAYDKDVSAFETAIGSLSDTNFVMYSPVANYGFVYNILIPFSEEQNRLYKQEEARATNDAELYAYRAKLLTNVRAKDLRTSWFDEHDHANSAFDAAAYNVGKTEEEQLSYYNKNGSYLFFKDNLTNNERYEELDVYLGQYPFNGNVEKKDNGEYKLKANTMNIDGFIKEMEGYFNYAVPGSVPENYNGLKDSYVTDSDDYELNEDKTSFTDYNQFIYYSGKVDVGTVSAANYFNPETKGYKAAAAFNELMFAYSTDTGCLNTYMGYVVSPFKTSYVPEFEYAAQWAVAQGAGTYVVCPSTYGWHIIYVTYVYGEGDVYGGYNTADAAVEGTFSYLYAEAMKEQYSADYANDEQNRLILEYDNETCVVRNQKTYQDLLDLDK